MIRIRLSPAQIGALQCRDFDPDEPAEAAVMRALAFGYGTALVYPPEDAEAIWTALNDASNAEDAYAEMYEHEPAMRRHAGSAARVLAGLGGKVLRTQPRTPGH